MNFKYRIAGIRFGIIGGPDNTFAVCEQATAEEMKMPFLDILPKDYAEMSYDEIRHIKGRYSILTKEVSTLQKTIPLLFKVLEYNNQWVNQGALKNGYQESFYKGFKLDLGDPNRFETLGEFVAGIYETINYYNRSRIHTALGMSPLQFAQEKSSMYDEAM